METKIWTEYYDWLTWHKKHKHLNLTIEQAFNAYKKELLLWEEVERVRVLNERIFREYYGGQTTSAGGGGGSTTTLADLLSFRFAGTDLAGLYGKGDELNSGWPETQNRDTLTKQGAGSVTYNANSAIIGGDGAHLATLNSTNPILNPFTAGRKQTYFWLGIVSDAGFGLSPIPLFNFFNTVNLSKLEVYTTDTDLQLVGTYQSGVGNTSISATGPIGFDPTVGVTSLLIFQIDLQDVGIFKGIINSDSMSTTIQQTVTTDGVAQSLNPINLRLGMGYSGIGQQPSNQEIFEFRAYDKILTNAEINTVISELNSTYGTTVVGV